MGIVGTLGFQTIEATLKGRPSPTRTASGRSLRKRPLASATRFPYSWPMQRLGRNRNGYLGETIAIDDLLQAMLASARHHGWAITHLDAGPDLQLPILTRSPRTASDSAPRLYASAGIHGDEPAGPLAMHQLIAENAFPTDAAIWLCPCLNPSGFRRNTREAASGHDLNRDYRNPRTPEIRAHVAWLEQQPLFDVTLCLHEDWEASGFYLYELNPDAHPSIAHPILQAVADVCPIDPSPLIDGREARQGLINPHLDPANRPEWPEAFFLLQNKTRLSYTIESPSDFDLPMRVQALTTATRTALACYTAPARRTPQQGVSA